MQEVQFDLLTCRLAFHSVLFSPGRQVCVKVAIPQAIHLLQSWNDQVMGVWREANIANLYSREALSVALGLCEWRHNQEATLLSGMPYLVQSNIIKQQGGMHACLSSCFCQHRHWPGQMPLNNETLFCALTDASCSFWWVGSYLHPRRCSHC